MKSSFFVLATLWTSLLCLATDARAQIDPAAVQVMNNMIATYQRLDSYSDNTEVGVTTTNIASNTPVTSGLRVATVWQKNKGLRIEGTHNRKYFVSLSDGEQVHTHWISHTQVDSDTPLNGNDDFLNEPMPGLPTTIPDIGFLTGSVTVEKLQQLAISRLTVHKILFILQTGAQIPANYVTLEYTTPNQQFVSLILNIGANDNILYMTAQTVVSGGNKSVATARHNDMSDKNSFPAAYWTVDAPLMGEAATVTDPPPSETRGLVTTLPTFTGQDISGKTFTVSPENQKTVLFYFFTPGSAEYVIDEYQQLAREGDLRGLQVVGVVPYRATPTDRTIPNLQALLAKHKITFPVCAEEGIIGSPNSLRQQLGYRAGGGGILFYGADGQLKTNSFTLKPSEVRAILNSMAPIPLH